MNMREILNTLLDLEKEARNAALVVDDEEYITQAKIERRVAQIEHEAKVKMATMQREITNETTERIKDIENEYRQKTALMESFFANRKDELIDKIVHEVLHGH